jgi:hypothetical protein
MSNKSVLPPNRNIPQKLRFGKFFTSTKGIDYQWELTEKHGTTYLTASGLHTFYDNISSELLARLREIDGLRSF